MRPSDCNNQCPPNTILIPPLNSSLINSYVINGSTARRCSFNDDGNCFYTFYIAVSNENFLQPLHIEDMLS